MTSKRWEPPLKDGHTYPVCMADGSTQELYHMQGRFFDDNANDVSDKVSYRTIWVDIPRRDPTKI